MLRYITSRLGGLQCWVLPTISGTIWLATLMAMLCSWAFNLTPHYSSMSPSQHIPYLSDIAGSDDCKPLFITGSFLVVMAHTLHFSMDRWLQHCGDAQLDWNTRRLLLSILACFFTLLGGAGLVILALFDSYKHVKIHNPLIAVFIAGYTLAAGVICLEKVLLSRAYPYNSRYRRSYRIKAAFIVCELSLTMVFGALNAVRLYDHSAVSEWTISFFFVFYLCSCAFDSSTLANLDKHEEHRVIGKEVVLESGWADEADWRIDKLLPVAQGQQMSRVRFADELPESSRLESALEQRICYRKMSY